MAKNRRSRAIRRRKPNNQNRARRRPRRRARGTAFGRLSRGMGAGVGFVADAMTGGRLRNAVDTLGSFITGHGDYQIVSNSLVGVPRFVGSNKFNIKRKEFIADISSSATFVNSTYYINPGLASTFPWLSQIAQNFDEYHFNGLIFEFHSTSANALNSTNTALGVIILATDYDVLDTAFASKLEMENTEFSVSTKPAESCIHPVECKLRSNVLNNLYVRSTAVSGDQRMYDLGAFQIASVGSQATATVGELWVSYDVDLFKPQLGASSILSYSHYKIPVAGVVSGSAYFGSTLPLYNSYETGSNVPLTFTNTTITFPAALTGNSWIMVLQYHGASTALTTGLTISGGTGCTNLNLFLGSATAAVNVPAGTTTTIQYAMRAFKLTLPSVVFTLSGGTLPTSLDAIDLFVMAIPSAAVS